MNKVEVYRNSGPADICISVPVPAGTSAIPAGIHKSINKVLYVII